MIPQKDIKFVQRKALQMYYEGKSEIEIKNFLIDEGGNEYQADTLSKQFYEDYLFLIKQKTKNAKSNAERDLIIGFVFFLCGLFFTFYISDSTSKTGFSILLHGPIISGIIFIIRGIIAKIRE